MPPAIAQIPNTQECWAVVDGVRTRYLVAGSGPPLLLIHGLLGYSFSWRFNMAELAKHRSVVAIDLPGTGFSERPYAMPCGMKDTAHRLWSLIDVLGVSKCDLLGSSHGGAVALYMASMSQERISRLILVAPANPWSVFGRNMIRAFGSVGGAAAMRTVAPLVMRYGRRYALARMYGDPTRIAPGTLEGYSAPFETPGSIEYGLKVLRCWLRDMAHLAEVVPRIRDIPTLLVWGSKDRAVDPRSAHIMQAMISGSELVMMDGVGHLPYEESPRQFNDAVTKFLKA